MDSDWAGDVAAAGAVGDWAGGTWRATVGAGATPAASANSEAGKVFSGTTWEAPGAWGCAAVGDVGPERIST